MKSLVHRARIKFFFSPSYAEMLLVFFRRLLIGFASLVESDRDRLLTVFHLPSARPRTKLAMLELVHDPFDGFLLRLDSRGVICHLPLTGLDVIKRGSDKAGSGGSEPERWRHLRHPRRNRLGLRSLSDIGCGLRHGGSRMSARKTRGVEAADLSSRRPAPMEAKSAESLPDEPGQWQFEPKWDGFRCLAYKDGGAVDLRGKSGTSLGRFFPEVVATLEALPFERFVVDGELVIELNGRMSFDALQARLHPAASRIRRLAQETPARLILFDMLVGSDGSQMEALPLNERRSALETFGEKAAIAGKLIVTPCTRDLAQATKWLNDFNHDGRDGVVAKRLDGRYLSGERAMIKVKRLRTADCVVGGFRYLSGRDEVGSLLLGLYNAQGLLDHVGFTSTIANDERQALTRKLRALQARARVYGQGAGRAQPLEHGTQQQMGAAQAGTRGRSALRPGDERPVPPWDQAHCRFRPTRRRPAMLLARPDPSRRPEPRADNQGLRCNSGARRVQTRAA